MWTKKQINIPIAIILLFITIGITYLLRFDIYEHDDYYQSFFYTNDLWDIIKTADHGRYFSWVYMKLIVHGTSLLQNIHPNDNLIAKMFVGINISAIALVLSLFATKPFKKSISLIWFISVSLGLFFLYTMNLTNIYRYNQHFAYQSNLFFYFLTWGIIATYFIQGEIPKRKYLIYNSLLSLILGFSAHFNILSTIGTLLFLFFYGFIVFFLKDRKSIISQFYQLGKGVYLPLFSFILGNVLYFSAPSFQQLLKKRSTYDTSSNRILEALGQLSDFLPEWFNAVFNNNSAIEMMVAIILCLIYLLILIKQNKIDDKAQAVRVIVLAISLILGVAFFNGTLLLSGRSMYDSNQYWVYSRDLILLTRMIQFSALVLLVGYITSLPIILSTPVASIKLSLAIKILFLCTTSFLMLKVVPNYMTLYDKLKADRANWYQTEKIYRFYSLQSKTAILPANKEIAGGYIHNQLYTSTKDLPYDWTGSSYQQFNYAMVYYKDLEYARYTYYKQEHSRLYNYDFINNKTNHYVPYIITNSNIAMQLYKDAGGEITAEELNFPIFNKLFDEKFVLKNLK